MMNLGSPKGIPITPIIMMQTNTINTGKCGLVISNPLINDITQVELTLISLI